MRASCALSAETSPPSHLPPSQGVCCDESEPEVAHAEARRIEAKSIERMVAMHTAMDEPAPNYRAEFLRSPHHAALGLLTLGIGFLSAHLLCLLAGVTLYGLPVILQGHNETLGWALTPNQPDIADVFVEPDTPVDAEGKPKKSDSAECHSCRHSNSHPSGWVTARS